VIWADVLKAVKPESGELVEDPAMTTSKAEILSVVTIRSSSPRSKISRTFPVEMGVREVSPALSTAGIDEL
jgi:hypothetical protein